MPPSLPLSIALQSYPVRSQARRTVPSMSIEGGCDDRSDGSGLVRGRICNTLCLSLLAQRTSTAPRPTHGVSQDPPGGDIPDLYFCLTLDGKGVAV